MDESSISTHLFLVQIKPLMHVFRLCHLRVRDLETWLLAQVFFPLIRIWCILLFTYSKNKSYCYTVSAYESCFGFVFTE